MAKKRKGAYSKGASSSKRQWIPLCSSTSQSLLLSLPDPILRIILTFSFPKVSRWDGDEKCSHWEWVGILSPTCQQIRHLVQDLAPKTFHSSDLYFQSLGRTVSQVTITGWVARTHGREQKCGKMRFQACCVPFKRIRGEAKDYESFISTIHVLNSIWISWIRLEVVRNRSRP
jgi:hypothetical protein